MQNYTFLGKGLIACIRFSVVSMVPAKRKVDYSEGPKLQKSITLYIQSGYSLGYKDMSTKNEEMKRKGKQERDQLPSNLPHGNWRNRYKSHRVSSKTRLGALPKLIRTCDHEEQRCLLP